VRLTVLMLVLISDFVADGLDPKPCSDADRLKYATPDARSDEDEDDALLKQMLPEAALS